MKNNWSTKFSYLSYLVLSGLVLTSCGSSDTHSSEKVVDRTTTVQVSEERPLVTEVQEKKASLLSVTDSSGIDVSGQSLTTIGDELIQIINNMVSSQSEVSKDDLDTQIDIFLDLLEANDVEAAKQTMLKRIQSATELRSTEELSAKNKKSEREYKIEEARKSGIDLAQKTKEDNQSKLYNKFGGQDEVYANQVLIEGIDAVIESQIQELDEWVAKANAQNTTIKNIAAAIESRATELAEIDSNIEQLNSKIDALVKGVESHEKIAETQKDIRVKALDIMISKLNTQIGFIQTRFDKEYQKVFEATMASKSSQKGSLVAFWDRTTGSLQKETADYIENEVIESNPDLMAPKKALDVLKGKLASLKAKRAEALEASPSANSDFNIAASNNLVELKNTLAEQQTAKAKYTGEETHWFGIKESTFYDKFLYDGEYYSEEELKKKSDTALALREAALIEIIAMDPETEKPSDEEFAKMAKASAIRSADFYRELIKDAFKDEIGKNKAYLAAQSNLDKSFADETAEVQSQFDQSMLDAASDFDAEMQKISTADENEKKAAQLEFSKKQKSLAELRDRLSDSLKSVVACMIASEDSANNSDQLSIGEIVADVENDALLANVTFNDYIRTRNEEANEDKTHDVSFENSNSFEKFIGLFIDNNGQLVSFKTSSKATAVEVEEIGFGQTGTETVADPENEGATIEQVVRGAVSYKVTQQSSTLSAPLSYIQSGKQSLVACAQTTDGQKVATRQFKLKEVAPQTTEE